MKAGAYRKTKGRAMRAPTVDNDCRLVYLPAMAKSFVGARIACPNSNKFAQYK